MQEILSEETKKYTKTVSYVHTLCIGYIIDLLVEQCCGLVLMTQMTIILTDYYTSSQSDIHSSKLRVEGTIAVRMVIEIRAISLMHSNFSI